jgi:hypothetical protein
LPLFDNWLYCHCIVVERLHFRHRHRQHHNVNDLIFIYCSFINELSTLFPGWKRWDFRLYYHSNVCIHQVTRANWCEDASDCVWEKSHLTDVQRTILVNYWLVGLSCMHCISLLGDINCSLQCAMWTQKRIDVIIYIRQLFFYSLSQHDYELWMTFAQEPIHQCLRCNKNWKCNRMCE